jgi:hypothetical protein
MTSEQLDTLEEQVQRHPQDVTMLSRHVLDLISLARIAMEKKSDLRERAAIAAMQGMLAYSPTDPPNGDYHTNSNDEHVARQAVMYADALVAELRKDG